MNEHPMRRGKNEITDPVELNRIIDECDVVRVGMSVDNRPYIVPMNFGFKEGVFYFHGAKEGKKIEMINANPKVCFELDQRHQLVGGSDRACDWTMNYESVMGTGVMTIVNDLDEKRKALDRIMQHYGGNKQYEYAPKMLERIGIMKLTVSSMSGKNNRR